MEGESSTQQDEVGREENSDEEDLKTKIKESLTNGRSRKLKIFLYLVLLISMTGIGSTAASGFRRPFEILEYIC